MNVVEGNELFIYIAEALGTVMILLKIKKVNKYESKNSTFVEILACKIS